MLKLQESIDSVKIVILAQNSVIARLHKISANVMLNKMIKYLSLLVSYCSSKHMEFSPFFHLFIPDPGFIPKAS